MFHTFQNFHQNDKVDLSFMAKFGINRTIMCWILSILIEFRLTWSPILWWRAARWFLVTILISKVFLKVSRMLSKKPLSTFASQLWHGSFISHFLLYIRYKASFKVNYNDVMLKKQKHFLSSSVKVVEFHQHHHHDGSFSSIILEKILSLKSTNECYESSQPIVLNPNIT